MGVVQIQADIQYKHKQADSKQTYKHMKAQTSRQQADIQTHESTWVVQIQAGIQYKQAQESRQQTHESTNKQTASRHTRHKKTTPDT